MITLDANLTLYPGMNYYLPSLKSQNSNAYSSIDQSIDAQAANGTDATQNTSATQNTDAVNKTAATNDPTTLINTLNLDSPESKFIILNLMPHADLLQFLQLLGKEQLTNGLNLFTKERLLQFVANLPKDQLLKMLSEMFISMDQVVDLIPIKDLNTMLSSKKIEKSDMLKIFQSLSPTELAQITEAATGIPQGNKSQTQLMKTVGGLDVSQLMDGVKGLEYNKMRGIVSQMLTQDPSLYNEFSQDALFQQTTDTAKTTLVQGMGVLDSDQLVKYLNQLPNNLLSLVDTQIDTNLMAQLLVGNYQKLLSSISL